MSKFINPYTFVSFQEVKNRKTLEDIKNGKYTGIIEYNIVPKTPLIIPNTSNDEFKIDNSISKSYGIFSYEDLNGKKSQDETYQPVIPGSEIRGCIRNVFEAFTNSCYNFDPNNDLYFTERVLPENVYTPGVLIWESDNKYHLYEADKYKDLYLDKHQNRKDFKLNIDCEWFEMFDEVYYSKKGTKFDYITKEETSECPNKGYLIIGNDIVGRNKTKTIAVLSRKGNELISFEKGSDDYKKLVAVIESFKDKDDNCTYQRYLDGLEKNKVITIYYKKENDKYIFSPAQIGRKIYNHSAFDLLGTSKYCKETLCPACLLFGNIDKSDKKESNKTAVSSRVRFTDAILNGYTYTNEYIDLISSSPKYSNKYFYSTKSSGWDEKAQIRGRKFYWHHQPNLDRIKKEVGTNKNEKLKSRYYYIDEKKFESGLSFKGKVYFENITIEELCNLYKSISLIDDKHMHKLGYGKPYGFGSCKFTVINIVSDDITLDEIKEKVKWENDKTNKELEYVLDFKALEQYVENNIIVHYPFNELGEEGYNWFVINKRKGNQKSLPYLVDDSGNRKDPSLSSNKNENNTNNYNGKYKNVGRHR